MYHFFLRIISLYFKQTVKNQNGTVVKGADNAQVVKLLKQVLSKNFGICKISCRTARRSWTGSFNGETRREWPLEINSAASPDLSDLYRWKFVVYNTVQNKTSDAYHTYVMNEFLTVHRLCTTKYF